MVTAGANQAFTNIALAICDLADTAGTVCVRRIYESTCFFLRNESTFFSQQEVIRVERCG